MLIFTEHITPRLSYVLNFIFRDCFREEVQLTDKPEEFRSGDGPRINYAHTPVPECFHIIPSGLLADTGISEIDPGYGEGPVPLLFCHEDPDKGFDVFSAVFYMISRYEEYLPFPEDMYGRFTAEHSLGGQNGFLELPVVDIWVKDLRKRLLMHYPAIRLEEGVSRFMPTCDIDLPYAYLHRSIIRTLAAGVRARVEKNVDLQFRREVLAGRKPDPFDTFTEMEAIHTLRGLRPLVFFLTSRYGKYDNSISPRSKAFRDMVEHTVKYADVGIHPSFRAAGHPETITRETATLSAISGSQISRSRQHYLKFRLPGSYRDYLEAGITEEYSMGYASAAGFRAGTCRPFYFYDLEREEETGLKVFPFHVMDRTLKDYMALSPTEAIEKITTLASAAREVGGTFTSIWHNDAFSNYGEWAGWKDVYLHLTDLFAG